MKDSNKKQIAINGHLWLPVALFAIFAAISISCISEKEIGLFVGFFAFCEIVVFAFTQGTRFVYDWNLFFNVLRFSLFLSPSLILLLPIIWLIAEILS